MTPGLLCATCRRPFAGRIARRTDAGFVHADVPDHMPCDDERHGQNAGYSQKCRCPECKAAHASRKRAMSRGELRPLPFGPLAPWVPKIQALLPTNSALRDAVEKARTRGQVSVQTADRIAVALGLHPGLIWPEDWWLSTDSDDLHTEARHAS